MFCYFTNHYFLPFSLFITFPYSLFSNILTFPDYNNFLIFSYSHIVVLYSISDYLDMRGYKHSRLDGSTNRVMREVKINLFNKPQSPQFIFCLSTRAGGEGVNLFTADTVILYDRYAFEYIYIYIFYEIKLDL